MLFQNDRTSMRRFFSEVWDKHQHETPLEPLEALVAGVLKEHPEYHADLFGEAALERDFHGSAGESNPFLHLGMHIAIREQLQADRPPGIRTAYQSLLPKHADAHDLEHAMMECLGACLSRAQTRSEAPDEARYLACVRRLSDVPS